MQNKPVDIELRLLNSSELRAEGESRTIRGYAAVYNSESENLGGFTEVIAPGAFSAVLGDDVRALVNHDDNMILARTTSGTLRLSTDSRGLVYEFDVPNTTYGNDLLESVRRGDISQSSFGFRVDKDEWEERAGGAVRRTILKVARLFDVSPVTYPAYPDTSVALRKMGEMKKDEPPQGANIEQQSGMTRAIIDKLQNI